MAKSVSDQNVEDMLSSVRRLVSSELPRNQRPALKEGASALVLTASQRVEPKPPMQAQRGLTLEERIAELEAAVDSQSNDWEPDGSEDQELHRPNRIVYRPSRPRDEAEAQQPLRLTEIALVETGTAPDGQDTDEGTALAETAEPQVPTFQREQSEKPAVEQSKAVNVETTPPDTSNDIAPPAAFAGDPFADAIARDVAAVVAEMAESSVTTSKDFEAALAEAVRDPAETRGRNKPARAAQEIAADAVDVSEAEMGIEPEQALDVSGKNDDLEDHLDDVVPASSFVPEGDPVEPTQGSDSQDTIADMMLDASEIQPSEPLGAVSDPDELQQSLTPAQLKLLVSSMIREELQGDLGERITRNVRKMVRQEVHRALSVRDLE